MNSDRERTVDRMLSAARLARRRGEVEAAWRCLDDAMLVAPDSADVLEEMGHLNFDEGEFEAAAQCFRRCLEREPGRRGAEVGLGNATVEIARAEVAEQADAAPDTSLLARRSPSRAALLSALLPGLGQMYATEFARGVVWLLAALPLWYLGLWGFVSRIDKKPDGLGAGWYTLGLLGGLAVHGLAAWDGRQAVQRLLAERRQVL